MAKSPTKTSPRTTAPPASIPTYRYDDRPDLLETFADKVHRMSFDGRTLRIDFCVNRPGEPQGHSIPTCRLVLDLDGAIDLFNKINSLQNVLQQKGVIRKG